MQASAAVYALTYFTNRSRNFLPFKQTDGSLPHLHKPATRSILIQINPLHILQPFFFKISFNIVARRPVAK
jgi:hypothetical protein